MVFLPLGRTVSLVLRGKVDGPKLVGECFVHGIMRGELSSEEVQAEIITLL